MDRIVGTCPFCHAPFDFTKREECTVLGRARTLAPIAPPPSVTTGTQTSPGGPVLELIYREPVARHAVRLAWCSGLLVCAGILMIVLRPTRLFLWPFTLGVACACAVNGYTVLTRAFRTTRLCVSPSEIRVERGPLVFRGTTILQLQRHLVVQFYVMGTRGLCALLHEDQHVVLAPEIESHAAYFMEQAIEQHLGMTDRAVLGEDLRV